MAAMLVAGGSFAWAQEGEPAPDASAIEQPVSDAVDEGVDDTSADTGADSGAIDEAAPSEPLGLSLRDGWSGPGYYFSLLKMATVWLLFLMWVYTTDWVGRDSQAMGMRYTRWNAMVFGVFLGTMLLSWHLPWFWLGFPLLVLAYGVPLGFYVRARNSRTDSDDDKVMTRNHIGRWMRSRLSIFGVKPPPDEDDPLAEGPPIEVVAEGGADARENAARLLLARQHPGFNLARGVLVDALVRHSSAIMLDYGQEEAAVRYQVDGVWHTTEPLPREKGDPALETLKILCGMRPEDRRGRQNGLFGATYDNQKYHCTLATQGTETGERAVMQIEGRKTKFDSLDQLGMRPPMQEQLLKLLEADKGFVLFSAMPASGLRTAMTVILRGTDRFMREFVGIEADTNRYEPVENIPVTPYKASEGQKPTDILRNLFLLEPNVVVCRDLDSGETLQVLCDEGMENKRLIISTIRSKDCVDALVRVLALKPPPESLGRALVAVLSQRLIRKLCEHCKEAYVPPPQLLKQLGIPAGKVAVFYRPPQEPEKVCANCHGIGYDGRMAIFELLAADESVRKAIAARAKPDVLRQMARKAGMRTLQEEGIVLVAKGVTSMPELMRVLKQ